jgi:hypothetical protein
MKKRSLGYILFIVLIAASIILTGCSRKTANEPAPAAPSKADFTAAENEAASPVPASTSTQASTRKLIVKLSMEMRVDNIEKGILDAEAMAAAAGGYTRESYQNEFQANLRL